LIIFKIEVKYDYDLLNRAIAAAGTTNPTSIGRFALVRIS